MKNSIINPLESNSTSMLTIDASGTIDTQGSIAANGNLTTSGNVNATGVVNATGGLVTSTLTVANGGSSFISMDNNGNMNASGNISTGGMITVGMAPGVVCDSASAGSLRRNSNNNLEYCDGVSDWVVINIPSTTTQTTSTTTTTTLVATTTVPGQSAPTSPSPQNIIAYYSLGTPSLIGNDDSNNVAGLDLINNSVLPTVGRFTLDQDAGLFSTIGTPHLVVYDKTIWDFGTNEFSISLWFKSSHVGTASTFTLLGLTRSLALEYADKGIAVNAISPGYTDTPIVDWYFNQFDDPKKERKKVEAKQPVGRLCQPKEVAAVAALLASDEARFIIGENIVIDGGVAIRMYE